MCLVFLFDPCDAADDGAEDRLDGAAYQPSQHLRHPDWSCEFGFRLRPVWCLPCTSACIYEFDQAFLVFSGGDGGGSLLSLCLRLISRTGGVVTQMRRTRYVLAELECAIYHPVDAKLLGEV